MNFEDWDHATCFSIWEVACMYLDIHPNTPIKRGIDARIAIVLDDLRDEVVRTLRINKLYNAQSGLHYQIGIAQFAHLNAELDEYQTIVTRNWLIGYFSQRNESPSFLFKQNRDLINFKKILFNENVFKEYGLKKKWISQESLENEKNPLPIELDFANQAWRAIVARDEKGKPKARLKKWLDDNTKLSNEAKERICIVANWDKSGGATKT